MGQQGRLVVITGPSGVGKGTLVGQLRSRHPDLFLSVSATTRSPRPGEQEGVQYYFMERAAFELLIAEHQLLEWAEYLGNYYGTLRTPVLEKLAQGQDVLLEIEVQGALQVMGNFPEAQTVFILPPSLEVLEARLRQRGTESPEAISRRLKKAVQEMGNWSQFRHQVVNDQLQACLEQLESILYSQEATHGSSSVSAP